MATEGAGSHPPFLLKPSLTVVYSSIQHKTMKKFIVYSKFAQRLTNNKLLRRAIVQACLELVIEHNASFIEIRKFFFD